MNNGPSPPPPASDGTTGVYSITVAAELSGMSVQALRLYERKGLLHPHRTAGGTRRYSDTDIVRLRRIHKLIDDGVNLTGIARVLGLEDDNTTTRPQPQPPGRQPHPASPQQSVDHRQRRPPR